MCFVEWKISIWLNSAEDTELPTLHMRLKTVQSVLVHFYGMCTKVVIQFEVENIKFIQHTNPRTLKITFKEVTNSVMTKTRIN